MNSKLYDLIVIGSGAAGITASITAAQNGHKVLLLEKLPKIGTKLKATGGGRCNLTNTLDNTTFMESFGKQGRFMSDALNHFDHNALIDFMENIGVATHIPDGFKVFPVTHNSSTIIDALSKELENCEVDIQCNEKVVNISYSDFYLVTTTHAQYKSKNVAIATGGLGYPTLGSNGDGYAFAKSFGHTITNLYPAMMPLHTKENWVAQCTADTIPKAQITIAIPKHKKIKAQGDLIFTKNGLRGPVILDFAREITPYLDKYKEVPILINMVKGLNNEQIYTHIKKVSFQDPDATLLEIVCTLLPQSIAKELIMLSNTVSNATLKKQNPQNRDNLIKMISATPLTIIGNDGFDKAMITRGGVNLKEIDPKTMQSKLVKGLYFCGEVVDLDGPCGGYNLQWSFSSGYLAGLLLK